MIYGVYIVSKSGGLIFHHDHSVPRIESEKTFSYPLDLKLDFDKKFITVSFGQRDGIFGELSTFQAPTQHRLIGSSSSWPSLDSGKWSSRQRNCSGRRKGSEATSRKSRDIPSQPTILQATNDHQREDFFGIDVLSALCYRQSTLTRA